MAICKPARAVKNLNHPTGTFLGYVKQDNALCLLASAIILSHNKCLFSVYLVPLFVLLVILLFKMAPKNSANVLSGTS